MASRAPHDRPHGGRRPVQQRVTTEEERQLLQPLAPWLNGRAFEAETEEEVHRQYMEHYGAFVRNHLQVDLPLYQPGAGAGAGAGGAGGDAITATADPSSTTTSSSPSSTSTICCCICESQELDHPEGNLLQDGADDLCRSVGSYGGDCCLEQWGQPHPHVAHRECYMAGILDSLLVTSGMVMSQNWVRQQPSCIHWQKLLDRFDIINVPQEGEEEDDSAASSTVAGNRQPSGHDGAAEDQQDGSSRTTPQTNNTRVVCRLKVNADAATSSECLFCQGLGLDDSTLEQMRDFGFCAHSDSPAVLLSLRSLGSFSPFPTGGTIMIRPCFSLSHAEIVLKHAIVGTFVDFGGYRASHLCAVVEEGCGGSGGNQGIMDQGDTPSMIVNGKQYLRIAQDEESGHACVPAKVVRQHGILKLTRWPEPLLNTLGNLALPRSTKSDQVTNFDFLSLKGQTFPDSIIIQPLDSNDELYRVFQDLREWVQETLPVLMNEAPMPPNRWGRDGEWRSDDTKVEEYRQNWKSSFLAGIQTQLTKLASWRGGNDDDNRGGGPGIGWRHLKEMESELPVFFSPVARTAAGCQQYRVDKCFNRLWDVNHIAPPSWDNTGRTAFRAYCRKFVPMPEDLGQTVHVYLANCHRMLPGCEPFLDHRAIRGHHCGPFEAISIPAEVCCREGYNHIFHSLHYAANGATMYALEVADAPYTCAQYIVVDTARSDPMRGGGLYLAHNFTVNESQRQRLEEIDTWALGAVQAMLAKQGDGAENMKQFLSSREFTKSLYDEIKGKEELNSLVPPKCSTCGIHIPVSIPVNFVDMAKREFEGDLDEEED